jgi:hypothetical protein
VFPSYVLLQREQYKNICNKEKKMQKPMTGAKIRGKEKKRKKSST